jgi:septal ring factor EnvC (AmiA/AmiB activator)
LSFIRLYSDVLAADVLTVDPDVKQKIDATIANAKQEIGMVDNERAEIEDQLKDVDAENAVFQKKIVRLSPLLYIHHN